MIEKLKNLYKKHLFFIFFAVFYLIFTILTYKLFPITADEKFRYQRGQELLSNIINSTHLQTDIFPIKQPDSYYFYGTILTIFNPNFYYEWYHLQNMLVSFVAFLSIYLIIFEYTKNPKFSVLGPILLFLTPSFSGHIAAAPIDIPFAAFFLLCLYLNFKFKDEPFSFKKGLVLGLSFWPVLGIRPIGFEFFLIFLFLNFYLTSRKFSWDLVLDNTKTLFLIFVISNFLLVITWPYLAINYFKNLYDILVVNASYDKWNNLILFNGELITKEQRPWNYLFTYLSYTTPIYILLLVVLSFFTLKKDQKFKILFLFVIALNFSLYLILHPVIYNGMRHFIFLIPQLVILAVFAIWDIYNSEWNLRSKVLILIFSVVSLTWTAFQIFKLFPVHYAYFNEISGGVGNNVLKYETDYWGASYKEAALYVKDNFKGKLKVYSCNIGFGVDYYLNKKFEVVLDSEGSDLIICDVVMDKQRGYKGEILHTVKLGNSDFVYIRKNP